MVQSTQSGNGIRLMDVRIPGGRMTGNLLPIHMEICVDILTANAYTTAGPPRLRRRLIYHEPGESRQERLNRKMDSLFAVLAR